LPETPLGILKKFVHDGQSTRRPEEPKCASVHATRSGHRRLAGWILLVAIGTVGVALWFAYRITRHLAVLERVAATIDADGIVPQLPETGPPELKATARA
jgi:hypothetical protein